jgi:acyl-CoA synthetase (AMP-forming)/AMP-acid ligase II
MAESIQIVNPEVRGESTLIQNDWFYSGDLASVDAEGYLYLKGRKSDLIIRGDVEIYPDDIESAFKVLPQIRDVGVVGVKANDESGEMPVVAIVSDEKFRAEFWASFFSVSLTVEQRPVRIIYVNSISRTPGGEIDRFALRQQVLNRLRAADKQTGLQIFA